MLEKYFLQAEQRTSVPIILLLTVIIVCVLGVINYLINGNSLFLIALVSLALAYPVINYVRTMDQEEIEQKFNAGELILRHEKELLVFLSIFCGAVLGMYVMAPYIGDFTYQEAFVSQLSGYVTSPMVSFTTILLNNLSVLFFTFLIASLFFAGLIFILMWNASVVAYYLTTLNSHASALTQGLSIMTHGVFEVGGYVLAGIAGSLIAYRLDRFSKFSNSLDKIWIKDISILLVGAILLVLIGAVVEVL